MRVLMIGIGDIAHKAYLPVLATRDDIELHLCSRNIATLGEVGRRWRITGLHDDLSAALTGARFDAALVHAATAAHPAIVERLLAAGIATFVDKPLADDLATAERLATSSTRSGVPLFVGFNRRYAPAYADLRARPRTMVIMEKHRRRLLHPPRQTVFDDFIHVVDTLRFLAPTDAAVTGIDTVVGDGRLRSIAMTMEGTRFHAVGAMNRDGGVDMERLTTFGAGTTTTVTDLATVAVDRESERRGDWTSVARQRGFEAMIDAFLAVARARRPLPMDDVVETHRICQRILDHASAVR